MASPAGTLERRCRVLLSAYPEDYRSRRGEEIVATMVEVTGPGRTTPHLADALDLVASGLRQRVAGVAPAGMAGGLAVAAPLALAIAAGISLFAWWRVEPMGVHTAGPIGYTAWLLAAAAWLFPRPAVGRLVIGFAIVVTLALPVVSAAQQIDRPPLWVLMALSTFGLLALAGTAPAVGRAATSRADERLAVPAGAVALAVCTSTVTAAWPAAAGVGYYYQPAIARVGVVVALAMAGLATVAIVRLIRGGNAQPWLWATVLLGLPAGWVGPFDNAGLRSAASQEAPLFGRLAQVLLASSVAMIAMAWLARRSPAKSDSPLKSDPSAISDSPARSEESGRDPLGIAAGVILGTAAGLAAFVVAGGSGLLGFAGRPWQSGVAPHVVITLVALAVAGASGVRVSRVRRAGLDPRTLLAGFVPTIVAAWLVASYDNSWTASGWSNFTHTTSLVMTLAFIPFTYGVIAATRTLARPDRPTGPTRRAALTVLALSLGWIGYVALPYLLLWGPVLVLVLAGGAVFALSGRRGPSGATQF